MSTYYFAQHTEQEKSLQSKPWIAPIGPDKSAAYHSYQLQRTFGDRPLRTVLEERPMHTKRNFTGTGFYNPPKQQSQVYYGPSVDTQIEAKKDGTPADFNAKLVMSNISKGEFQERLKQLDLESTMYYNRDGYHGTIDRKMQFEKDKSFAKHGHQPWVETSVGWKHSGYVPKLGGLQVSRATTF